MTKSHMFVLQVAFLGVLAMVGAFGISTDASAAPHSHIHNKAKVTCKIGQIKEAVVGDITLDCDAAALVASGESDGHSHIHNTAKVKCKIGKIKDSIVGDITLNCSGAAIVVDGTAGVDNSHIHNKTNVQCKIGKIKDSDVGDITITCDGFATVITNGDSATGSHISNKSNVKCKIGKIQGSTVGDVSIDCDSKATVTPTSTPKPTPKPTSTPTPEDEDEEEEDKDSGLRIAKSDGRDITRPGHSLTYRIVIENTGEVDLHDVKVTDHVPAELTITSISSGGVRDGRTITWNSITLDANQKKTVSFTATVKDVQHGTVIKNVAVVKSDDHGLSDNDADSTTVEVVKKAAVAGTKTVKPVSVPVSAKTGAAGMLTLVSTLLGGSGLTYVIRKGF